MAFTAPSGKNESWKLLSALINITSVYKSTFEAILK